MVDIEEKYASLKEEAVGKSKKLKKVWNMLMSAKSEVISIRLSSYSVNYSFFQIRATYIHCSSPKLHHISLGKRDGEVFTILKYWNR